MDEEFRVQTEGTPEEVSSQAQFTGVENGVAGQVQGESVVIENSLVGVSNAGQNATVENSVIFALNAGANASVENSGGLSIVAGNNIELTNGGASFMVAGGNVEVHNGGAGFIFCQQAAAEHATINVLLTSQAQLGEGVKVVFSTKQAAALGAAFGAVVFVLSMLFRRQRR